MRYTETPRQDQVGGDDFLGTAQLRPHMCYQCHLDLAPWEKHPSLLSRQGLSSLAQVAADLWPSLETEQHQLHAVNVARGPNGSGLILSTPTRPMTNCPLHHQSHHEHPFHTEPRVLPLLQHRHRFPQALFMNSCLHCLCLRVGLWKMEGENSS